MRTPDGRLLHGYKDGQARFNGYLDDYACLIDGMTRLFEAAGEPRWIEAALGLSNVMIAEFRDAEQGGFFYTGQSHEALIARQKDAYDNATPSGNAMAATALLRLAALTGRDDLADVGRETLQAVHLVLEQAPMAAGQSLIALDFLLSPTREFALISGEDPAELRTALETIAEHFLPDKVVAPATEDSARLLAELVPLLADRPAKEGRVTAYLCEKFTCQAPVVGVEALKAALGEKRAE
jgi:uncharacterized protein YyaL (SSP411 family)